MSADVTHQWTKAAPSYCLAVFPSHMDSAEYVSVLDPTEIFLSDSIDWERGDIAFSKQSFFCAYLGISERPSALKLRKTHPAFSNSCHFQAMQPMSIAVMFSSLEPEQHPPGFASSPIVRSLGRILVSFVSCVDATPFETPRTNFLDGPSPKLHPAAAAGHDERLAQRVRVPRGARCFLCVGC